MPMPPVEDVFKFLPSGRSKGTPASRRSRRSKGMRNTVIGSGQNFEFKLSGSGMENSEIGSTQMKNPVQFNLFPGSGLENTVIGSTQMKNPVQFDFLGSGMGNTEIGSTHMKIIDRIKIPSKSSIKNLEIGSSQKKHCGIVGNTADMGDDLSNCSRRACSRRSCSKLVLDRTCKDGLKRSADTFLSEYIYSSGIARKTYIGPGYTYSWDDKSSRIMWVGVHGMDSVCVVTRDLDMDMIRLSGGLNRLRMETAFSYFRRSVISEIEYLADPDTFSAIRPRFDKGIEKPFGVVYVIPRTDEVHKASGHEASNDEYVEKLKFFVNELERIQPPGGYDEKEIKEFKKIKRKLASTITEAIFQASSKAEHDEKKAIEFLQEKLRSNMGVTVNETIQTAISAFQHLFQKKFKANEIKVSVIDPDYLISAEEANNGKHPYVKELEMSEIEEYLAVINEALEAEALAVEGRQSSTTEEYVRPGSIYVGGIQVLL